MANYLGHYVHGDSMKGFVAPEYEAWSGAKQRCYNPKKKSYKDYGARGIEMCDRWLNSYETFLADMGRKPSSKHTLERIDVNGDYSPLNCKWELKNKQSRNRNYNRLTMVKAREIRMLHDMGYAQWVLAKQFKVSKSTISAVIQNLIWKEEE